jgi:hypothetical protein
MTGDLLSRIWANPAQPPDLSPWQWESLLGQARQAGLLGRLAQHHVDHGWLPAVPERPRRHLEGALRLVERLHHELRWEVECVRRALAHLACPVVLLKGAAYFVADLPPRRGRLFSDIDIMVERSRLPDVERGLFRAGWIVEERDAYNERYYRDWMHEIPPMRHVQRGTVIDVHHTITPPTSRFRVDGTKLLERIEAIGDTGSLFVLAPVDMVLHSAVHLFQEGDFHRGLRDLLDLNDLMFHFSRSAAFWPALFTRAADIGLGEPLFHALQHTFRLFGTRPPTGSTDAETAIRTGWVSRTTVSPLLGLALRPDHPSCNEPFSRLARWLLYARSHYLRMPPHLVVPHLLRKAYMRQFGKIERTSRN